MWNKKWVHRLLFFNLCLLVFAAGVALYMILLDRYHAPFVCSFAKSTHLYCPGCGFTRAVRALLSFDILASLAAHPLAAGAIGVILYYEVAFLCAARGRGCVRAWPAVAFAVALLGFFLLRNLLLVLFSVDFLGDFRGEWGVLLP